MVTIELGQNSIVAVRWKVDWLALLGGLLYMHYRVDWEGIVQCSSWPDSSYPIRTASTQPFQSPPFRGLRWRS